MPTNKNQKKPSKVLILGVAGNVGSGIAAAFTNQSYEVIGIDPSVNRKFEDINKQELAKILDEVNLVIYSADLGNRDLYTAETLSQNQERFEHFCKQLSINQFNKPVYYIGGSWTKRSFGEDLTVTDFSPNKSELEANEYENAKIIAEKYSEDFSKEYNLKIRFVDYISIVPNFAPNFSIYKMVEEALTHSKITYSAGNFGRPLLDTVTAGKFIFKMYEQDNTLPHFATILVPGIFTEFKTFADTAKEVVEEKSKTKIKLVEQDATPDFLKVKIKSKYINLIDTVEAGNRIRNGLIETAENAIKILKKA